MGKRDDAKRDEGNNLRTLERFCLIRDMANLSRGLIRSSDPLHLRLNNIKNEVEDSISIIQRRVKL